MLVTLPAIIFASTPLGQIYPWTQPMLAMSPEDESPIQSYFLFYTLLIGSFIVLLLYGVKSFTKRDNLILYHKENSYKYPKFGYFKLNTRLLKNIADILLKKRGPSGLSTLNQTTFLRDNFLNSRGLT
ncbi:hypothetical protein OKW24_003416 [Peribacillus simplex]|nr:hypothetical protein [Peribacillus simplex]